MTTNQQKLIWWNNNKKKLNRKRNKARSEAQMHTKKGYLLFVWRVYRDSFQRRHNGLFPITKKEWYAYFLDSQDFNRIFNCWELNNWVVKDKPCIVKKGAKISYTPENFKIITYGEYLLTGQKEKEERLEKRRKKLAELF